MTTKDIIEDLHSKGYSYRDSKKYLHTVLSMIKYSLAKHEDVVLPFGVFKVCESPKRRRVWALGTIQTYNKRKYRIKFKANS